MKANKIIQHKIGHPYWGYIHLSILLILFTAILSFLNTEVFYPYFNGYAPLLSVALIFFVGGITLFYLQSKKGFILFNKKSFKGWIDEVLIAVLLATLIIMVDCAVVFPKNTNVLPPISLLFYPVMGLVADIIFHLLPLSLLLFVLTFLFPKTNHDRIVWISIVIVSFIEPVYQVLFFPTNLYPHLVMTYLGVHIFVISFYQLVIFKRADFISMYAFRLVYYLLWHIIWGHVRLELLF
ncbi:MAG: hypothetical protein R2788_24480 [Saprospiraceae bacterium]